MRLVRVISLAGVILCCLSSFAEDALKIGYVDTNEVFRAYDKVKGESIRAEKEKSRSEHAGREEEVKKLNEKLKKEIPTLTAEEKEKRSRNIQKKIEELVEFDRAYREKEQEYIKKALTEIYRKIEKIGEREGFDLIIEGRSIFGKTIILFGKKSLDVTDKVIKELKI
jgi:Skp family chaperone for outer membrane proteins